MERSKRAGPGKNEEGRGRNDRAPFCESVKGFDPAHLRLRRNRHYRRIVTSSAAHEHDLVLRARDEGAADVQRLDLAVTQAARQEPAMVDEDLDALETLLPVADGHVLHRARHV